MGSRRMKPQECLFYKDEIRSVSEVPRAHAVWQAGPAPPQVRGLSRRE